ncbi:glycosyltransferase family 39 protein [Myxococcota bacterium]|nr:glycosyltransferase family 39 protein [Myxococcota bacterium]
MAVSVLAFAAVRAPLLDVPLERDEGEYAYIAWRWLEGELPYREAFDQKPPLVFAAYASAFALLGVGVDAVRVLGVLWTAGTTLLLYMLVRRLGGPLPAAWSALLYGLASADPVLAATATNTELLMAFPTVAAALALWRGLQRGDRWNWILFGALAAIACGFKQVAVTDMAWFTLFGLFSEPRAAGCWVRRWWRMVWIGVGAAIAVAPVALVFGQGGAFSELLDATLWHNADYVGTQSAEQSLATLAGELARQAPGFWPLWTAALAGLVWPDGGTRRVRVLLLGWLVASAAGVSVGAYYRAHYFIQALPPLCALAGLGLTRVLELWERRVRGRPLAVWAGVLAMVGVAVGPTLVSRWTVLSAGSGEAISRQIYGVNPFPEAASLAEFVARVTSPEEPVLVVGSEPEVLFLARRPTATRYIFMYPLTGPYPDALDRQREALAEIADAEPSVVVWFNLSSSLRFAPGAPRLLFDELRRRLGREFRIDLLAWPVVAPGEGETWELRTGAEARARARALGPGRWGEAWIAVYRRTLRATNAGP